MNEKTSFLAFIRFLNLLHFKETKSELRILPVLRSVIGGSLLRALILLSVGGFQRALYPLEIPGSILCLCRLTFFWSKALELSSDFQSCFSKGQFLWVVGVSFLTQSRKREFVI